MAKETFYFQHDYNARNDDRVLELRSRFGGEGYGVFWMIVETMAENEHGGVKVSLMGGLSHGYGVAKGWLLEFLTACVEIGLFYEESGTYYSKRLLTHKEFRKFLSEKGSAGAAKRWGGDSPPNGDPNAKERKGKEIKGKDNKGNKSITVETFPTTPADTKKNENMVVIEMIKIFKAKKKSYIVDDVFDYPACLEIAYKIAKLKGWKKMDIVEDKEDEVLISWKKIVDFIVSDKWFTTRTLADIGGKEWNRIVQSMEVSKKEIGKNGHAKKDMSGGYDTGIHDSSIYDEMKKK